MMNIFRFALISALALMPVMAGVALADPLPGQIPKFQQAPMIELKNSDGTATYFGHDEESTLYNTDALLGTPPLVASERRVGWSSGKGRSVMSTSWPSITPPRPRRQKVLGRYRSRSGVTFRWMEYLSGLGRSGRRDMDGDSSGGLG